MSEYGRYIGRMEHGEDDPWDYRRTTLQRPDASPQWEDEALLRGAENLGQLMVILHRRGSADERGAPAYRLADGREVVRSDVETFYPVYRTKDGEHYVISGATASREKLGELSRIPGCRTLWILPFPASEFRRADPT